MAESSTSNETEVTSSSEITEPSDELGLHLLYDSTIDSSTRMNEVKDDSCLANVEYVLRRQPSIAFPRKIIDPCLASLRSMVSEGGPSQLGPTQIQGSYGCAIFCHLFSPIAEYCRTAMTHRFIQAGAHYISSTMLRIYSLS